MTFKFKLFLGLMLGVLFWNVSFLAFAASITPTTATSTDVNVTYIDETWGFNAFNPSGVRFDGTSNPAGTYEFNLFTDDSQTDTGVYYFLQVDATDPNYQTDCNTGTYTTCLNSTAFKGGIETLTITSPAVAGANTNFLGIPAIADVISSTTEVSAQVTPTFLGSAWLVLGVIIAVLVVGFVISTFGKASKATLKRY